MYPYAIIFIFLLSFHVAALHAFISLKSSAFLRINNTEYTLCVHRTHNKITQMKKVAKNEY